METIQNHLKEWKKKKGLQQLLLHTNTERKETNKLCQWKKIFDLQSFIQ